jgi:hypothetical protein
MEFRDPKNDDVFNAVANTCRCVMHSFYIKFAFGFDADPRRGVGGQPSDSESWRIGIVQNVVYEKVKFKYSDGALFEKEWPDQVLDSSASLNLGFYNDPVTVPACQVDPRMKCSQWLPIFTPVHDIVYGKAGYKELVDSDGGQQTSTVPTMVDMYDEPAFGARMRREKAVITIAEHILAFQVWLVAQRLKQLEVLAYIEPFSLVFALTAQPRPDALSIQTPPFQYNYYGVRDITHSTRVKSSGTPTVRMYPGRSKRTPLLDGQTANERGRTWLRTSGLLPD